MCEEKGFVGTFFGADCGRVVSTDIFVNIDFLACCSHVLKTQWQEMWGIEDLRLVPRHF